MHGVCGPHVRSVHTGTLLSKFRLSSRDPQRRRPVGQALQGQGRLCSGSSSSSGTVPSLLSTSTPEHLHGMELGWNRHHPGERFRKGRELFSLLLC